MPYTYLYFGGDDLLLVERMEERMKILEIKSWRDLARRTQLSPSYIGDIKSKRTQPSLSTLQRIARELQTTTGYLLGETNDPDKQNVKAIGYAEGEEDRDTQKSSQASRDLDLLIKTLASKNPDLVVYLRNTATNIAKMSDETKQTLADGLKYVLGLAELKDMPRLKDR
jgi:transcriptional regulator with XRE-family HTH domain